MPPVDRLKPIRAASSESGCTLLQFMREWPDDATCLEYLWRTRHSPDGETAFCPKCETDRTFKRYDFATRRQSWTCTGCGHHIHPTAGTIFEKSSTSLHLWFYAMYLMTSTRAGFPRSSWSAILVSSTRPLGACSTRSATSSWPMTVRF